MKYLQRFAKRGIVVCLVIAFLLYMFPVYNWLAVLPYEYYNSKDTKGLLFRGLPNEHLAVDNIKETAEAAFSDLSSTEDEAYAKYGVLSHYCTDKDSYPNVVKEEHDFKVCSVDLNKNTDSNGYLGYMWVYYNQEGLTEEGKIDKGSWKVYSLWCLDKNEDGQWYVSEIKEAP